MLKNNLLAICLFSLLAAALILLLVYSNTTQEEALIVDQPTEIEPPKEKKPERPDIAMDKLHTYCPRECYRQCCDPWVFMQLEEDCKNVAAEGSTTSCDMLADHLAFVNTPESLKRAADYAEKACRLKSGTGCFVMGRVAMQDKKYRKAVAYNRQALQYTEKDDQKASCYYNIACAYSLMNRKKEAIDSLKRAIALNKEHTLSLIPKDSDFDNIKNEKTFKELIKETTVEVVR